jgi:hypothetical protein
MLYFLRNLGFPHSQYNISASSPFAVQHTLFTTFVLLFHSIPSVNDIYIYSKSFFYSTVISNFLFEYTVSKLFLRRRNTSKTYWSKFILYLTVSGIRVSVEMLRQNLYRSRKNSLSETHSNRIIKIQLRKSLEQPICSRSVIYETNTWNITYKESKSERSKLEGNCGEVGTTSSSCTYNLQQRRVIVE